MRETVFAGIADQSSHLALGSGEWENISSAVNVSGPSLNCSISPLLVLNQMLPSSALQMEVAYRASGEVFQLTGYEVIPIDAVKTKEPEIAFVIGLDPIDLHKESITRTNFSCC